MGDAPSTDPSYRDMQPITRAVATATPDTLSPHIRTHSHSSTQYHLGCSSSNCCSSRTRRSSRTHISTGIIVLYRKSFSLLRFSALRMEDSLAMVVSIPRSVLIIGAGPAGLATAALLAGEAIPYVILERADCTASLWKNMTYDRLHLHLPKRYCELPLLPFPASYPQYPSRDEFVAYLDTYAQHFHINPMCNTTVTCSEFAAPLGEWVVTAEHGVSGVRCKFTATTLVVATGENAEAVMPVVVGREEFAGKVIHGKDYRNGKKYEGEKVLVVGCGNTGMEIALDLANFGSRPTLVVRSPFHVMPRELFGLNLSTFDVSMKLLKVFPLWFVDKCLVFSSWLTLGGTAKYNLIRPKEGPLAMKARTGQTPVLDVGTVAKIRSGEIKVMPTIERLTAIGARFVNGVEEEFDAIIMATGYASTVSKWLKAGDGNMFGDDGFPKNPFPNGWKGENGLYAVGFGRKGLLGCAHDAKLVAEDIAKDHKCSAMA